MANKSGDVKKVVLAYSGGLDVVFDFIKRHQR